MVHEHVNFTDLFVYLDEGGFALRRGGGVSKRCLLRYSPLLKLCGHCCDRESAPMGFGRARKTPSPRRKAKAPQRFRARTGVNARGDADDGVCNRGIAARSALLMAYVDTSVLVALCVNEPMGAPMFRGGTRRVPKKWPLPRGA
jgi:hypothetical protein